MHTENRIQDGFYEIVQNAQTQDIDIFLNGEKVKTVPCDKMLTFEELRDALIRERKSITEG